MKNLVIINDEQFGYHTDTLKYVENLQKQYQIIFICQDHGKERINGGTAKIVYIKGNSLFFPFRTWKILQNRKLRNYYLFIKWHPFSFVYSTLRSSKKVLDIRTLAVVRNPFARLKWDIALKFDIFFYKNISLIDKNLKNRLEPFIYGKKTYLLPLGADINPFPRKLLKDQLKIVYIGTFNNRNLITTIKGVKNFRSTVKEDFSISYDIFGTGSSEEVNYLNGFIQKNNCSEYIKMKGYLPNSLLNETLLNYNVGMSYIPILPYYQNQPPTKTYEYLANGLVVLATATRANKNIVNRNNGIVVNDTAEEISKGLEIISQNLSKEFYKNSLIKGSIESFDWKSISEQMIGIFQKL